MPVAFVQSDVVEGILLGWVRQEIVIDRVVCNEFLPSLSFLKLFKHVIRNLLDLEVLSLIHLFEVHSEL